MFKKISLELTVFSVIVLMAFAGFVSLQDSDNELTGEPVLIPPPSRGGFKPSVSVSGSVLVPSKPTTSTTVTPCSGPKGEKGFVFPIKQPCPAGNTGSVINSQVQCCYQPAATSVVTTQPKVDLKVDVCRMVKKLRDCGKQAYAAGNNVQGACCKGRPFYSCSYGTKEATKCNWFAFYPGKSCSQACPNK